MGRTNGISICLVLLALAGCHPPRSAGLPARVARPEPELPFDLGTCPGEIGPGLELVTRIEDGADLHAAIEAVLGARFEEIQKQYAAWIDRRLREQMQL